MSHLLASSPSSSISAWCDSSLACSMASSSLASLPPRVEEGVGEESPPTDSPRAAEASSVRFCLDSRASRRRSSKSDFSSLSLSIVYRYKKKNQLFQNVKGGKSCLYLVHFLHLCLQPPPDSLACSVVSRRGGGRRRGRRGRPRLLQFGRAGLVGLSVLPQALVKPGALLGL